MGCAHFLMLLLVSICATGYCRRPTSGESCLDAASRCRGNHDCGVAYRSLDKKCKVFEGRCSAAMVDLPRCGQIMDFIFSLGFPQEPCRCTIRSLKCSTIHEKIYANPCFASIRHLRKHDLFPTEIKTYSEGSDPLTTSASEFMKTEYFNPKHKSDVESVSTNDITTTFSVPFPKHNNRKEQKSSSIGSEDYFQTQKVAVTKKPKQIDVPNGSQQRGITKVRESLEEHPRKNEGVESLRDETDYKLITIILGSLLGILILVSVVFFVWTRARKRLFYTNVKVQVSARTKGDGGPSSRSEGGISPRSKA